MKTTITVEEDTRSRLNKAKYNLQFKSIDETINKVFDIAEEIKEADENISNLLAKEKQEKVAEEIRGALP